MVEGFRFHEVQEKGRLVLVEYASKEKMGRCAARSTLIPQIAQL